jgi:U6 snRNA-associated Sm-like protein LSm7
MASKAVLEKEAVVDFANYADQRVRVKIQGGREVEGVLKGYDKLDNLVLDETIEYLRGKFYTSWTGLCTPCL